MLYMDQYHIINNMIDHLLLIYENQFFLILHEMDQSLNNLMNYYTIQFIFR